MHPRADAPAPRLANGHRAPTLGEPPAWQQVLARCRHVTFDTALFAMPLARYLGSVFSGYPVKWFGVTLPAWGWNGPTLKGR